MIVQETEPTFVDCGVTMKAEAMKEEIDEEESVDDSLFNHFELNDSQILSYSIKVEKIKKAIEVDPLTF